MLSRSASARAPARCRLRTISRNAPSFVVACRSVRIASCTTKSENFIDPSVTLPPGLARSAWGSATGGVALVAGSPGLSSCEGDQSHRVRQRGQVRISSPRSVGTRSRCRQFGQGKMVDRGFMEPRHTAARLTSRRHHRERLFSRRGGVSSRCCWRNFAPRMPALGFRRRCGERRESWPPSRNGPFGETRRAADAIVAPAARFPSRELVSKSKSHDFFAFQGFVRHLRSSTARSDSQHAQSRCLIALMHWLFQVRWKWVACLQMGASGTALSFRWPDQQFE